MLKASNNSNVVLGIWPRPGQAYFHIFVFYELLMYNSKSNHAETIEVSSVIVS